MSDRNLDPTLASDSTLVSGFVDHLAERLLKTRTLYLTGGVDDRVSYRLVSSFLTLDAEAPGEPITFYLNSPGGSVTAGFSI
ncbi:MAG: ATP-dependent Clp protease proteolytic subunit, partial [Myxococcales bacterium]|nr:ATP-dependent Clp protease proteolytic subunit [Myxococcales bacterium]